MLKTPGLLSLPQDIDSSTPTKAPTHAVGMVQGGLYRQIDEDGGGDGGWFVFGGITHASQVEIDLDDEDMDGDGAEPQSVIATKARLDGEDNQRLPLPANLRAARLDGQDARTTLREAHIALTETLKAADVLMPLFMDGRHAVRVARDVNSGDPVRIAKALAQATIMLRNAPRGGFDDMAQSTPYRILHRRALGQLARLNAMVFNTALDEAMKPLQKAADPARRARPLPIQAVFPYAKGDAVAWPVYDADVHGAPRRPVAVHRFDWFSVHEHNRKRGRYIIMPGDVKLRPDSFRLLQALYRKRGEFCESGALQAALYPDVKSAESMLSVALSTLKASIARALAEGKHADAAVILSGRKRGLRFMKPGETWVAPKNSKPARGATVRAKKKRRAWPVKRHDFGHFAIDVTSLPKRTDIRFTRGNRILTPTEFKLLEYLRDHDGQWVTRAAIGAVLFPGSRHAETRAHAVIHKLAGKMQDVLGRAGHAAAMAIARGAGVAFALPGTTLPEPPARTVQPRITRAALPEVARDFGHFKLMTRPGLKRAATRFEDSDIYLSPKETALLEHLHAHAGAWRSRAELAAILFAGSKYAATQVHTLTRTLSDKMEKALGAENCAAFFQSVKYAGLVLTVPGQEMPVPPARAPRVRTYSRQAFHAAADARDFGHFSLLVAEGAKRTPALFAGTSVTLSGTELALVEQLHKHAGKWIAPREIAAYFFPDRKDASSRGIMLTTGLEGKLRAALGAAQANAIFNRVSWVGVTMAVPGQALPGVPLAQKRSITGRFARTARAEAARAAASQEDAPPLHYHPIYGPGYDLGAVTREIMGQDMTLRRFMPVTEKDPRDQAEVMLAPRQIERGYGRLDMDAYRAAMEAGARELRGIIESRLYTGPDHDGAVKVLHASKSPADIIPVLASFVFHAPTARGGSAANRLLIEKVVARGAALAYPHVTVAHAMTHLRFLQTHVARLPAALVWPFATPETMKDAAGKIAALTKGQKNGKAGKAAQSLMPGENVRRVTGGINSGFDVHAYMAQRAPSQRPLTLG